MPRMNGREVLRRLREAPPCPHLKVIMFSGRRLGRRHGRDAAGRRRRLPHQALQRRAAGRPDQGGAAVQGRPGSLRPAEPAAARGEPRTRKQDPTTAITTWCRCGTDWSLPSPSWSNTGTARRASTWCACSDSASASRRMRRLPSVRRPDRRQLHRNVGELRPPARHWQGDRAGPHPAQTRQAGRGRAAHHAASHHRREDHPGGDDHAPGLLAGLSADGYGHRRPSPRAVRRDRLPGRAGGHVHPVGGPHRGHCGRV